MTSGVPQGSIVGPFLFALLMDDICCVSDRSKLVVYVDDITVCHHYYHPHSTDLSQMEVDNIISWADNKRMIINQSKCAVLNLCLSPALAPTHNPLLLSNHILNSPSELKILGVIFSHNLKWDSHFNAIYNKCCRSMAIMKRLHNMGTPSNVLWQFYLSMIFSHMAYAWPVFCDLSTPHLRLLNNLEKRAALLTKREFNQADLEQRLSNICVKLARKIGRYPDDHPLRICFQPKAPSVYSTRSTHKFLPIKPIKCLRIKNTFTRYGYNT
jgi:hypothetical protein